MITISKAFPIAQAKTASSTLAPPLKPHADPCADRLQLSEMTVNENLCDPYEHTGLVIYARLCKARKRIAGRLAFEEYSRSHELGVAPMF